MSGLLSFDGKRNVTELEWNEAASSMSVAELSDAEMSSLSSWQRAAVERLPAAGQRCLHNSWMLNDRPQGCSRIQRLIKFYSKHTWS